MAIGSVWRKGLIGSVSAGAIAVASMLITGPTGNDGLEGMRSVPYKDVVGVKTVCFGHTGADIIPWKHYSDAECKSILEADLQKVAKQIDPYITKPIPVATRGALYSFAYNVGARSFQTSTLLRKINTGDTKGACDALRNWTYAGGKKWQGLVNRREIEREVCLWR